ncbi:homoserine O-succinyltransferase [Lactobacillaceae bacterium L1_55_11]|nr:homoserine O-succinyltransferase [Lactobacillaceae bacterium L1_55_11]
MTANAKNGFLKREGAWSKQAVHNPVKILIWNLMPNKAETEAQFLSLLDELDQDVLVTFMYAQTHHFKSVAVEDLAACYCTLDDLWDQNFDGLIITGAPVEQLPFEAVDYWCEFKRVRRWAQEHVSQTINACWSAQAALYHDFDIQKRTLPQKLFGIYQSRHLNQESALGAHLETFFSPQSRHSESVFEDPLPKDLELIAENPVTGPQILQAPALGQTYVTGHAEYLTDTLDAEYRRDLAKGAAIAPPVNYYDRQHRVCNRWRASSIQLYQNWLNLIESEIPNYERKSLTF